MTPKQLERRNEAIRLAWDCPLLRAVHRRRAMELWKDKSPWKRDSGEQDTYNAYYRDYYRRNKDRILRLRHERERVARMIKKPTQAELEAAAIAAAKEKARIEEVAKKLAIAMEKMQRCRAK